jgi:hypothetical protein
MYYTWNIDAGVLTVCRMIGIGFSSSKASVERLPGWEQESWAYHGDDGKSFFGESQGQGRPYGPTFGANDTVGCGVNFATGCAFFTKNGVFLGMFGGLDGRLLEMKLTCLIRKCLSGIKEFESLSLCGDEEATTCALSRQFRSTAVHVRH